MSRYNQSEENRKLKALQIEKREIELERLKNSLVTREAAEAMFMKQAAEIRSIFVSLPSRIRQEMHFSLDQQAIIERVVDEIMAENLKGGNL